MFRVLPILISSAAILTLVAPSAVAQRGSQGRDHGGFSRRSFDGPPQNMDLSGLPPALRRAIEAAPKLRYSGERTIEFRRGAERKSHKEYVWKNGSRLKIWFPADSDFAGQVIVEDDNSREHYYPGRNEIEVMGPRREEAFSRLLGVISSKKPAEKLFAVGDPETIAGIKCTPVGLKGPEGIVFIKMWIEPRTGAILRRDLFDPAGTLVGTMEFQRVDLRPKFRPGDFELRIPSAKRLTPEDLARRLIKDKGMLEAFLPADEGYKLEGSRMLGISEKPTLMLFYQGTKGRLTLHQVTGEVDAERLRRFAGRQFNIYIWQARGKTFALIGEQDKAELQRIAAKVRF